MKSRPEMEKQNYGFSSLKKIIDFVFVCLNICDRFNENLFSKFSLVYPFAFGFYLVVTFRGILYADTMFV